MELSSYLEKVSGFFLAPNKPITGQNAFSHKSGVHTNGILKDPRTYEPFDPAILGRERKIVIDKYTGKSAVASRLDEYGIEVSAAELEVIVTRIKNMGDQRKQLFDADILEIAEQVTGREIDVIPHDISAMVMIEVESHVYTSAVVRRTARLFQCLKCVRSDRRLRHQCVCECGECRGVEQSDRRDPHRARRQTDRDAHGVEKI